MDKKAWWRSKTLWVNVIAGAAFLANIRWGFDMDLGTQGAILAVVNLVLRLVTKEPLGLKDE